MSRTPITSVPFRLHYSDGTTQDISATSAAEAREMGKRDGLLIEKCKIIKETN
ncbi:hypothetical protein [Allorhizobium undicola]|uniref:hypothetical protein n=1 Tax=Allorhizobium undicola TaxID=78527 RepID=UPI000B1F0877|nr:hypothetical protein [Allorhizobium undicola]